jgi:hypothetical protein
VLAETADLVLLLEEKESALRLQGDVSVGRHRRTPQRTATAGQPARADTSFQLPGGEPLPWITARGTFAQFTFTRTLTDPDWVPGLGCGVSLDATLPAENVEDICTVLTELSGLGLTAGGSHWRIQQSQTDWHGTGAYALVEAMSRWEERHADLPMVHHTEDVCFQDVCDDGFYTLTFGISASPPRRVWHADLSLQLAGIPLEPRSCSEVRPS